MLSVIIPAFNEEQMISKTTKKICDLLENEKIEYEILFVDDGSKDNTWNEICAENSKNHRVKGISFSRNFGKEAAVSAGLLEAKGACAVVIDCDLQHPPLKIIEMYNLWEQGYEVVEGIKSSRGNETALHSLAAKCFYGLISKATAIDMSNASDFKLIDRKVINALINIPEKNTFFRALSSWVGYKSIQIEYDVQEREAGESKWSTSSLIKYALTNIASFSSVPMQIVTILGIAMFVLGVALSVQSLYKWFIGVALGGFTTVIILQCFSSSIIMLSIGIIGYYISKIYEEVKGRPRFIISEITEHEESN